MFVYRMIGIQEAKVKSTSYQLSRLTLVYSLSLDNGKQGPLQSNQADNAKKVHSIAAIATSLLESCQKYAIIYSLAVKLRASFRVNKIHNTKSFARPS